MTDDSKYDQYRNPIGDEGRKVIAEMNEHHRPLTEWALSNLPKMHPKTILDIGCGGGMMISLLGKKFPKAAIVGIDISEESLKYSEKTNEDLIAEGRCCIRKESVESIPFEDGNIDLAISCESYFFWPDLVSAAEEISRVTGIDGYAVIISESYPHPDFKERNDRYCELSRMNLVSNDYMEALLGSFGFEVTVITKEENNWVEFIAKKVKPSSVFF